MRRATSRTRRQVLWSVLKWLPTLAVGFSVLLADVWLNTRMRVNDYRLYELTEKAQILAKELSLLRVEEVSRQELGRLDEAARRLSLAKPNPGQIIVMQDVEFKKPEGPASVPEVSGNGHPINGGGLINAPEKDIEESVVEPQLDSAEIGRQLVSVIPPEDQTTDLDCDASLERLLEPL